VTGLNLAPRAELRVQPEKGVTCEDRFVRSQVLDLAHARITVGGECMRMAGVFSISAEGDKLRAAWVHVASPMSPVLQSVLPSNVPIDMLQGNLALLPTSASPSKAPADKPHDKLALVLRGSGFTEDSTVFGGYFPAGGLRQRLVNLDTAYVSPTELRAHSNRGYGNDSIS
jgi:hypothetical protein